MNSAVVTILVCLLVLCAQGQVNTSQRCKCSKGFTMINPKLIQGEPVIHHPSIFCSNIEIIVNLRGVGKKCVNPKSWLGKYIQENISKSEEKGAVTMTTASRQVNTSQRCKCSKGFAMINPKLIQGEPVIHHPSIFCSNIEIIVNLRGVGKKCVNPKSRLGKYIQENINKSEEKRAVTVMTASTIRSVLQQHQDRFVNLESKLDAAFASVLARLEDMSKGLQPPAADPPPQD
ncbi:hypothetical protein INR49_000266, partial [Caranx melampygus]